MDPSHIGILVVCIFLVILSGYFSAAETAYSSANKVRLRTLSADGNKKATNVLKVLDNYDKLISSLLIGNNIANIALATLSTVLFTQLVKNVDLAAVLSTIVVTVVVLIFCEITPKIIAREVPERACMALNSFTVFLQKAMYPITILFILWKKLLRKVFKFKHDTFITEDELKTYVETAKNDGGITQRESDLIRSAIEFDDLDVYDIMTPRVNVIAVEENESFEEIKEKFFEHGYSRLPVYSKNIDSIIGVLHEKDFYYLTKNDGVKISDILRNSVNVSRTMKISGALSLLQKSKVHMAIVVDEFGGTEGIITIEDIIEELVGEIWDEHDEIEVLIRKMDDGSFIVSGTENIDTMFEALGMDIKDDIEAVTVGGWVLEQLQRIPVAGEKLEYNNLIITVTKATAKRVSEIRVKLAKKQEDD